MSFRRRYGQGPLHLVGHLVLFGIAAFAFDQIFSGGAVQQLLIWYIGFALLHDLVFLPLYTLLDRIGHALTSRLPARRPGTLPIVNHVRVPAVISGVLLIVYAPLIFAEGQRTYLFYSGHHVEGYLRNWLLITFALFAVSGLLYAVRSRRARHS